MKISSFLQFFMDIFLENLHHKLCVMDKDLKIILKEKMKERGIKTPELAEQVDIPKDRIYAWYRDGSNPKAEDRVKIEKWINGETSNNTKAYAGFTLTSEGQTELKYLQKYIDTIEKHNAFLERLIETNLTLVLATARTISVRQEATGETVLHSLERLEKKAKGSLVSVADKRRDQIEQAFSKHDNAVAQSR